MRLESSRLTLVPIQFTDANDLNQGVRESLADLRPWYGWAREDYTLRDTQNHIQQGIASERAGGEVFFVLRAKSGKFIGELRLTPQLDAKQQVIPAFDIGIWIRNSEAGNGYGAEALKTVADHATNTLHARRLAGKAHATNEKLSRIFEDAGFQREAVLKNTQRLDDETLTDTVVYARIA